MRLLVLNKCDRDCNVHRYIYIMYLVCVCVSVCVSVCVFRVVFYLGNLYLFCYFAAIAYTAYVV